MEMNSLVKKGKINAINGLHLEDSVLENQKCLVKVKAKYNDEKVREYIEKKVTCEKEKLFAGLKMVLLSNNVLEKSMLVLSSSEYIKVELVILLLKNVSTIILFQFDNYFMEKDLLYYKKLFKKLVKKYGKTIVILDAKLTFLIDLAERMVIKNENGDLEIFSPVDFYDERVGELIEVPAIIDFVRFVNKEENKIHQVTELKELIKDIYRVV